MASYIDSVLIDGEKVLHRGSVSRWGHFWLLLLGVLLAPIGIGLILLLWAYVLLKGTELAITNKRIIVKTGLIARKTVEINLNKVESIQVEQSVWGRMLDFGTITVSGTGVASAPLERIAEPLAFRREFMRATDRSQSPGA